MIDKLKRIKVNTPKGERTLVFTKYNLPTTEGRIPCQDICPYAKICDDLPHPEFPDNKEFSFIDFCGGVGISGDDTKEDELDLIPAKGTLENNLKDLMTPDVYQKLLKEERLVKINEVVDSFCSGFCEEYTKDHSKCQMSNPLCLMREVFVKGGVEPEKLAEKKEEEKKEEKDGGE